MFGDSPLRLDCVGGYTCCSGGLILLLLLGRSGSRNFNPANTTRGGLRNKIEISPPLFGGRGSWVPFTLEANYKSMVNHTAWTTEYQCKSMVARIQLSFGFRLEA
ncbi:unnamed protein product [Arabidopsis halleri]